jgi:chemotaxis protein methyltransferase CheR
MSAENHTRGKNDEIEIRLLLEAIYLKYGYDFRQYGKAHLKRRILRRLGLSQLASISEMQHRILIDRDFFETLLLDLSINVSEMFRDPHFYLAVRQEVVPELKTYPFVRIWHAGCATGEEVYSMAIMLTEEGLYERSQIYATDFNEVILQRAREGIYPVSAVREYTSNYQKAGGTGSFSDYYTAKYDAVIFHQKLREKIVFADHNLATDGVFGEMHLIFCRNVLIYFEKELQQRAIQLFYESLRPGGFLCLGAKESLRFTDLEDRFETFLAPEKIYRKKLT